MSVKYVAPEIELHLGRWSGRLATAGLLFAASCLVFLPYGVGGRIPMELRLPLWVGIALGFLFAARLAYRSMQLHRYWPVLYAFFVASAAQLVDWHFSDWLPRLLNVPNETPAWFALVKLESSLLIVLVITVLILLARADFGSLYLKRGRTWWGLLVGLELEEAAPSEVVLTGPADHPVLRRMMHALHTVYLPATVCLYRGASTEILDEVAPFVSQHAAASEPLAYVCRNGACEAPVDSVEGMLSALGARPSRS